MKVIILAGGKATRLPKSAKNIPKPLVKIAGKTILQHQIDLLEKHGLTDIRLSLGYKANQIINYLKGRCEYVIEPEPLGTGGAIKFASKDLKEELMVLNGDNLMDINLAKFVQFHKEHPLSNSIIGWFCEDARGWGLIKNKGIKISEFKEKPKRKCQGLINAGVYILSPEIFKSVKTKNFSIEYDIFPNLVKQEQLAVFVHRDKWMGVNTEEDVKIANQIWKQL
jgi:NDP-sugar pyrophosphorylase family protein